MEVKLISYTQNADAVCSTAAKNCYSNIMPECKLYENTLKNAIDSDHTSILEHCLFTFSIEGVSRITETQLVRHRLASYEIQSGRYCSRDPSKIVLPISLAKIIMDNENSVECIRIQRAYVNYINSLLTLDDELEKIGVLAEDRRYLYPQGLKTNIIVSMNARELIHFFSLRCCGRAQAEIRALADKMLVLCKEASPMIFAKAGASCDILGYCPEKRSCGRTKEVWRDVEYANGR